jgi:hypothetical protein
MEPKDDLLSIRLGTREIQEAALLSDLEQVKGAIKSWGTQNELWHDTSFATPFSFHNEAPRSHDTLLLISEGPLASPATSK